MKKSQEKINDVNLKSAVLNEISSINNPSLLKEVADFLAMKRQLHALKTQYGDNLYDSLNTKKLKKERSHENNIYINLIKLLKKLTKERNKNPGIKDEDKNMFDPNEPVIKDILSKSMFVGEMGLEEWMHEFQSTLGDERIPFVGEHYISFENGKIKYERSTIYTTNTGGGPGDY